MSTLGKIVSALTGGAGGGAQARLRDMLPHGLIARMPARTLDRPVFMVGLPRSGTTIVSRLLGNHRQLAHWSEAPMVWDKQWRSLDNDHRWTAADAAPDRIRRVNNNFAWYASLKRKGRILNKHPRNSLRIPFLAAGWPDCLIINVERDPRAVVNSLVERTQAEAWRRDKPLGQFARPVDWREIDACPDVVEKFTRMTLSIHQTLSADLRTCIPPARLLEIRYEDFAADVRGALTRMSDFCGLAADPACLAKAPEKLENRNFKWAQKRSQSEVRTMARLLGALLIAAKYEKDDSWVEKALSQAQPRT